MARSLQHNSADIIAKAKDRAMYLLSHDFRSAMINRFNQIKENVEDWETAIENETLLVTRLKNIANNTTYTETNLLDMALICAILHNTFEPIVEKP